MKLRETKKEKTKKIIIKSAGEVFSAVGYEDASILEIASRAGVGVGTIYNYFQSKQDIYMAFFSEEFKIDEEMNEVDLHVQDKPAVEAIEMFLLRHFKMIFTMNRSVLYNLLNITVKAGMDSFLFKSFYDMDMKFIVKLAKFIEELKKKGTLVEGIDATVLSEIIYSVSAMELIMCFIQGTTQEAFEKKMHVKIQYLLKG